MSLLDTVKKNLRNTGRDAGGSTDETGRLAQLMRTKATGKAVSSGGGPAASSIAEQSAASQARLGGREVQRSGALAAEGVQSREEGIQRQSRTAEADLEQIRSEVRAGGERQRRELLGQLERAGDQLDFDRDSSSVEQLGFLQAMDDDQYRHELQLEGERSRLTDANRFEQELQRSTFSDMEELLRDDLDFQSAMRGEDREFNEYLAGLDISFAEKLASQQAAAANQRAIYEGVGSLAGAGVSAYGSYDSGAFDSDYQQWQDDNPDKRMSYGKWLDTSSPEALAAEEAGSVRERRE